MINKFRLAKPSLTKTQLLISIMVLFCFVSYVTFPCQAQVSPDWQKKVDIKDAETQLEEQRLEAYRKNIPELHRRAKEALEKNDKEAYNKNLNLLKQTLAYMDQVFKRKYAPWFTPEYFDDTVILPDKSLLSPLNPLGMAEAYRYGPAELERERRFAEAEKRREELGSSAGNLEKQGLLKPGSMEKIEDELSDDWKKISEDTSFIKKATDSCDPKTITKALSLLEHYLRISYRLTQIYTRQLLRPMYSARERDEIRLRRDSQASIQAEQKEIKRQLEEKLKACPPKTDKPKEQNELPNQLGTYQSAVQQFEQMNWSATSKPISPTGEMPSSVPQDTVSLGGEFIMLTPSPSSVESNPQIGSDPIKSSIAQMCDMLVNVYRQNLMSAVDQGWKSPKPPQKGVYVAKFTYGIQQDGGLYLPPDGEAIHMLQSSGYSPIDQAARARIYELFGPSAPFREAGGYKRPLPSCFTETFLKIDHTFRVIYR